MKNHDDRVMYLGNKVGRVLHIVHIDCPPGKVSFSFSTCNQIRSTLMDTIDGTQQSSLVCAILFVTSVISCAD